MAGSLVYFEIRAGDRQRARSFWGELFNWTFSEPEGVEFPYWTIDTGAQPSAGMYESEKPERGLLVYFDVDDIDAAAARVVELGGEVVQAKSPVPGMGWFAACRDTEGNDFSLWQTDESVAGPE